MSLFKSYFRRCKERKEVKEDSKVINEEQQNELDNNEETTNNQEETREMTMNHDIDFDFISKLEGGRKTEGYVPDHSGSKSGVTIATGVDLGQWNETQLRNVGVPENLIEKLKPYLGLIKNDALQKIRENPLTISKEEARILDRRIKNHFAESFIDHYNTNSNISFKNIEPEKQTVIVSVAFQYGIRLDKVTPNFWRQITNQMWNEAYDNLRDFGDRYPTRRNKEADLLKKAI